MNKKFDLSSAALHILAMVLMLCDHLWATLIPGNLWLTCIGRIAYPIFAFLIVEGYFHTRDLKKYVRRLLIAALASEIPFNLMYSSSVFYPFHQNVLWTFLIGIWMMHRIEKARQGGVRWRIALACVGSCLIGYLLGTLTMVDYGGVGVLTVLVFCLLRGRNWWNYVGQALALYCLNFEMIRGLQFEIAPDVFLPQQGFAILALLPIRLYRGRKGHSSRAFRYFCYAFYPVHMLVLYLLSHYL